MAAQTMALATISSTTTTQPPRARTPQALFQLTAHSHHATQAIRRALRSASAPTSTISVRKAVTSCTSVLKISTTRGVPSLSPAFGSTYTAVRHRQPRLAFRAILIKDNISCRREDTIR